MSPETVIKALSTLYELYAEQEGVKFKYTIEVDGKRVERETGRRTSLCTKEAR